MKLPLLQSLKPTECDCPRCRNACQCPCWPTPDDAKALIKAGHAKKLMLNWYGSNMADHPGDIFVLCPANPGYGGQQAATEDCSMFSIFSDFAASLSDLRSGCVFFSEKKGCALHASGLKPTGGKLYHHGMAHDTSVKINGEIAALWNTRKGKLLITKWKRLVGFTS